MRRAITLAALTGALALIGASGAGASGTPVYVNCDPLNQSATSAKPPAFDAEQHPARCNVQGEPEDIADLLQLEDAHWTHWGAATATARGRALSTQSGMGAAQSSSPVTLSLTRIQTGCDGKSIYTRATLTSGKGKGAVLKLSDGCRSTPLAP